MNCGSIRPVIVIVCFRSMPAAIPTEFAFDVRPSPLIVVPIERKRFITLVFVTLPNSEGLSPVFSADPKKGEGGIRQILIGRCRGAKPRPIPHAAFQRDLAPIR